MGSIWQWLNGRKTQIGVIISVILSVLARRGVAIPDEVFMVSDAILGVGVLHKVGKTLTGAPAAAKAGAAALLLCVLGGCAGLTPSGGAASSAGAPQPATNLAQTARDQAAVPGQSYGGHVNWYFASQGAAAIQQSIIDLAKAGSWTPEQLAAALASTNGAPHSVTISTGGNVSGGDSENLGSGTSGASSATGGATIDRP